MGLKKVARKRSRPENHPSVSPPEDEQTADEEQEQEEESRYQEPAQSEDEVEVLEEVKVVKTKPSGSVKKPIPPTTKNAHPLSSDSDSDTHLDSETASSFILKPVSPHPKKLTSAKRLMQESEKDAAIEPSRKKKNKMKAKVVEEEAPEVPEKKSGVGASNKLWKEKDKVVLLEPSRKKNKAKAVEEDALGPELELEPEQDKEEVVLFEPSRRKNKAKVVEEEEVEPEEPESKNKLWKEKDEVVLLEGLVAFRYPDFEMGNFYEGMKKYLTVDVSRSQFKDKIHKLKRKYITNRAKWEEAVSLTPHDDECFELAKKIWDGGKENENRGDGSGANVINIAGETEKRDVAVALPEENDGQEGGLGEENKTGVDGNPKSKGSKRGKDKAVKLDAAAALPEENDGKGGALGEENKNGVDGKGKKKAVKFDAAAAVPGGGSGKEEVAVGDGSKGGEMKNTKVDKAGDFLASYMFWEQSLAMEKPVKSFMLEKMRMIGDVKAKEVEGRWKDLLLKEAGLYLERLQLIQECVNLCLNAMKASKD